MGASVKPHIHSNIDLSCTTCIEEIRSYVTEGMDPEALKADAPALWEHLRICPTCAETYLALLRTLQAVSAEEIPCELCTAQMEAAAEQSLTYVNARERFPEAWKHIETCPICAPHYAELLRLTHHAGHRDAHIEDQALRRMVTRITGLALVLISGLILGALWWLQNNEEAIMSRIYQETSPAIVLVDATVRTGSGMIFDHEGHILTNNHVVEGADEIAVRLVDGALVEAQLVGRDPATDLAVLQIDIAGHPTGVVRFGNSDRLKVGDLAVVIGNPFQFERSLSAGYISALNRILSSRDPYGAQISGGIQTDAAINPGNSGGPLFNSKGEVVGITTSIVPSRAGGSTGVGFAVPINTAKWVIQSILEKGYVSRPYLGVIGRPLTAREATRLGQPIDHGLVVRQVDPDSPADRMGLLPDMRSIASSKPSTSMGDVILALDGQPVTSMTDLWRLVQAHETGDEVVLTVLRDGRELELTARLQEQPRPAP